MIIIIFVMYTDINGVSYKLCKNKAIIQKNNASIKIEIFPTITVENKTYEVMFPDDCGFLFYNEFLMEFTLHKLLHSTTNVTSCKYMFKYCKFIKLDLKNFNTDNVTNMNEMFSCCDNMVKLNVSSFNTKNVNDMGYMLFGCQALKKLDLTNFNTENVTDMAYMFGCDYLLKELNLSSFNVNNIIYLFYIFSECNELVQVDATNFDIEYLCDHMVSDKFILANYSSYNSYYSVYDINCNNVYSNN